MDPTPCPICGLDVRTISPADTQAAVRSFPRRWTELLSTPTGIDDRGPEDPRRRRAGSGWSALEHARHVGRVLQVTATSVEAIRLRETPEVPSDPDPQLDQDAPIEQVLEEIR